MNLPALKTSVYLSLLFLICYGGSNQLTAHRHDVGTWVYSWEHYIPFVPIMILPYMSIDLFFIAAPFLCSTDTERRLLSRRITMAILVSTAFFLIMPLRFTFPRPHVAGPLGLIFNNFRLLDQPYNQFPSLHITLRTILADLYFRHTRGPLRTLTQIWFSLIGASTLLTYQHHVIDIVGGFALAALIFYVLSDSPWRIEVTPNPRVGLYYATGSAFFLFLAILYPPSSIFALWPALSFALISAAYFKLGPAIYRKHDGRIPFAAKLLFAPVLAGQWLSLRHYARQSNAWDKVTDHAFIGRVLSPLEAQTAIAAGVTAVLDLTCEFSAPLPFRHLPYLNIPILDMTTPTPAQLQRAAGFISEHAQDGVVYVHCKAGYSRSAAAVAAHLLYSQHCATANDAISLLQRARPRIIIRPEALAAIQAFHAASNSEQTPNPYTVAPLSNSVFQGSKNGST